MILVSIIMPAYNAEMFIKKSIDSVLHQTYQNWELLVVNDGSIDKTADIVRNYNKDKRIKLINQENKRLGAARNAGIRSAAGKWIAFLDADDLWDKNKLQQQMEVISCNRDVDVIYTNGYIFYGEDLTCLQAYPTKAGKFLGQDMYKMQYQNNYIPILSVIVAKSIVDQVGLQEENPLFHGCEDWDYWLRMGKLGAIFIGMPEKLFYYRRHENNMSGNTTGMRLAQLMVFIKNLDKEEFSTLEVRGIFKPLVTPLIITLLKNKKEKEASLLMQSLIKKVSFFNYLTTFYLVRLLGKHSIFFINCINKIDSFLFIARNETKLFRIT